MVRAALLAQLAKRVTAHCLRHSFATHPFDFAQGNRCCCEGWIFARSRSFWDMRMCGRPVRLRSGQAEIYTQLARSMRGEIVSPLDDL